MKIDAQRMLYSPFGVGHTLRNRTAGRVGEPSLSHQRDTEADEMKRTSSVRFHCSFRCHYYINKKNHATHRSFFWKERIRCVYVLYYNLTFVGCQAHFPTFV